MRSCLIAFIFCFSVFIYADEIKYYPVVRVVDGDTVVLQELGKVRLLGVDTPETKHPKKKVEYFGQEASAFLSRMLTGQSVRVEYDHSHKDKYNRVLAYLYLKDGTFVNAAIIDGGYGHAYTRFPIKHLDYFRKLERSARENKRGLWKDEPLAVKAVASVALPTRKFSCDVKKKCSAIKTCDEAKYLLNVCGFKSLDRDRDGIPCAGLCGF